MNGLILIIYLLAVGLSCMSLALGIASQTLKSSKWKIWYVIFQSCLLATMIIGFCNRICYSFLDVAVYNVFSYIFPILTCVVLAFTIVLLPYFCSWVLAFPLGKKQMGFFLSLAVIYLAAGITDTLVRFSLVTQFIELAIVLGVLLFCLITLWKNLDTMTDENSRKICLAINIVSICLIPSSIAILFFPFFKDIAYPVYVIAFSTIMLIFFFVEFSLESKRIADRVTLTAQALSVYHITEREAEVIGYICSGMTNKEIASKMDISVNTVNNHVANIFDKMKLSSRMDLMRIMKTGPWA